MNQEICSSDYSKRVTSDKRKRRIWRDTNTDLKTQASFVFLPQKICGNSAEEFRNFGEIAKFLFG